MAMMLVNVLTRCAPDKGSDDSDGTQEPNQKKSKQKKKRAPANASAAIAEEVIEEPLRDKSPRSTDTPPGQSGEQAPRVRGCPFLGTTEERRARHGTTANGYDQEEPEAQWERNNQQNEYDKEMAMTLALITNDYDCLLYTSPSPRDS